MPTQFQVIINSESWTTINSMPVTTTYPKVCFYDSAISTPTDIKTNIQYEHLFGYTQPGNKAVILLLRTIQVNDAGKEVPHRPNFRVNTNQFRRLEVKFDSKSNPSIAPNTNFSFTITTAYFDQNLKDAGFPTAASYQAVTQIGTTPGSSSGGSDLKTGAAVGSSVAAGLGAVGATTAGVYAVKYYTRKSGQTVVMNALRAGIDEITTSLSETPEVDASGFDETSFPGSSRSLSERASNHIASRASLQRELTNNQAYDAEAIREVESSGPSMLSNEQIVKAGGEILRITRALRVRVAALVEESAELASLAETPTAQITRF